MEENTTQPPKKSNKMLVMAAATGAICLLLLAASSAMKKKRSAPAPQATDESNTQARDSWAEIDKAQDILTATETVDGDIFAQEKRKETVEMNIEDLSVYPAPSYVSPEEDTLIYKKGIYTRIGFTEEKKTEDTITIDGIKYIKID